jgi:hypothetical protein
MQDSQKEKQMNGSKIYIGIDPGIKGALTIVTLSDAKNEVAVFPFTPGMPAHMVISEVLKGKLKSKPVVVELVHSFRGQGIASSFTFGVQFGYVLGSLEMLAVPYVLLPPATWQRPFNLLADKKLNPKKRASIVFRKIFNTTACEGGMDAALMAVALFIKKEPKLSSAWANNIGLKIIPYDTHRDMNVKEIEEILYQLA